MHCRTFSANDTTVLNSNIVRILNANDVSKMKILLLHLQLESCENVSTS